MEKKSEKKKGLQPNATHSFIYARKGTRARHKLVLTYHISCILPYALYGRPPPYIPCYFVGSSLMEEVDKSLAAQDRILTRLKANLVSTIIQMK